MEWKLQDYNQHLILQEGITIIGSSPRADIRCSYLDGIHLILSPRKNHIEVNAKGKIKVNGLIAYGKSVLFPSDQVWIYGRSGRFIYFEINISRANTEPEITEPEIIDLTNDDE